MILRIVFSTSWRKAVEFLRCRCSNVTAESIDMEKAYFAARYGRGDADYINCGMNEQEYKAFYQELIHGEVAPLHEFDRRILKCTKDVCQ